MASITESIAHAGVAGLAYRVPSMYGSRTIVRVTAGQYADGNVGACLDCGAEFYDTPRNAKESPCPDCESDTLWNLCEVAHSFFALPFVG